MMICYRGLSEREALIFIRYFHLFSELYGTSPATISPPHHLYTIDHQKFNHHVCIKEQSSVDREPGW